MLKTQRLLGRCGAGNKGVQEAQRLLESAGRKATVNLRNGLWIRGGGEKHAAVVEQAEQVELVSGFRTHMNSLTVEYLPHCRFNGTVVCMEMFPTV